MASASWAGERLSTQEKTKKSTKPTSITVVLRRIRPLLASACSPYSRRCTLAKPEMAAAWLKANTVTGSASQTVLRKLPPSKAVICGHCHWGIK
ncbi:hypothetical protein D3C75_917230 [compost metagenome]